MSYRRQHVDTVKSKHGVADGWPVPSKTNGKSSLSDDLDRAAARRAASLVAEPYSLEQSLATRPPQEKKTTMSYTSSERVKLVVYTSGVAGANGKRQQGVRVKLPKDIVARLGKKPDDLVFDVEIDDDGILLRPTNGRAADVELPTWVQP